MAAAADGRADRYVDLLDHESQLIAQYMQHASALVMAATSRVSNRSSTGEAAANRLRIESEVAGLVRTAKNLCTLTRRIRELWIVGPLRASGEGDVEAELRIREVMEPLAMQLEAMQGARRQHNLGKYGTYQLVTPGMPLLPPEGESGTQSQSQPQSQSQSQSKSQQPSQPQSQPAASTTSSQVSLSAPEEQGL
ncbi:hypothetical protein SEPCBS119000_003004 [Sporothrix epigloea]|uniref:Uncharacterized protein n=1 Tax=Sporothrix epigloea TaxID=1892477 RepID=A0ABP0DJE9_9PEZI